MSKKSFSVFISLILFFPSILLGQLSPTLTRSSISPPDISERYRPNPKFYEVMSAFPHNNSYYMYDFNEVQRSARRDLESMVILGDHYRIGRSTQMDLRRALREYERAASRGYAKALHRIAYMYADGLGLPKDNEKILEYLKRSADDGYVLAQYDYALVFLNGKFRQSRDYAKAYKYLLMAAEQGHESSIIQLAMLSHHASAYDSGIPAGLKIALDYYGMAGDTDGERALMQNLNSLGALKYYMRIIPDFIPGINPDLNPKDQIQGIELIKQLKKNIHLVGEDNFKTYKKEIVKNILYHNYFESQGAKEKILKYIIFCDKEGEWLKPHSTIYYNAAIRDFRMLVDVNDEQNLKNLFEEFKNYPAVFEESSMDVVADRVFAALFLQDSPELIKMKIVSFIQEQIWIINNLSKRYIVDFEEYHLEKSKRALITEPGNSIAYINGLGQRLSNYPVKNTDTLTYRIIPEIRNRCIHPLLSEHLEKQLIDVAKISKRFEHILSGLSAANENAGEDINVYFHELEINPNNYFVNNYEFENRIAADIHTVRSYMELSGKMKLDTYCDLLTTSPDEVIYAKNKLNSSEIWEISLGDNLIRWENLMYEAWQQIIKIDDIFFYDPNEVMLVPEEEMFYLKGLHPCIDNRYRRYSMFRNKPDHYNKLRGTISNFSDEHIVVRVTLEPVYDKKVEQYDPFGNIELSKKYHSEALTLPANEKINISFTLESSANIIYWRAGILLEHEDILLLYKN